MQARLRRRVVRTDKSAHLRRHGREVDDAPPAPRPHAWHNRLRHQEAGFQIGGQYLIPILLGDLIDRLHPGDARIVYQDIDRPEIRLGRANQPIHFVLEGDVRP